MRVCQTTQHVFLGIMRKQRDQSITKSVSGVSKSGAKRVSSRSYRARGMAGKVGVPAAKRAKQSHENRKVFLKSEATAHGTNFPGMHVG